VPDLLDDLQVHRAPVGVGDRQFTVHIVDAQYTQKDRGRKSAIVEWL
jgi:hypothetical protein